MYEMQHLAKMGSAWNIQSISKLFKITYLINQNNQVTLHALQTKEL